MLDALSSNHVRGACSPGPGHMQSLFFFFLLTGEAGPCEEKSPQPAVCGSAYPTDRVSLKSPAQGTQPLLPHCVTIQISDRYQSIVRMGKGQTRRQVDQIPTQRYIGHNDIGVHHFEYVWLWLFWSARSPFSFLFLHQVHDSLSQIPSQCRIASVHSLGAGDCTP